MYIMYVLFVLIYIQMYGFFILKSILNSFKNGLFKNTNQGENLNNTKQPNKYKKTHCQTRTTGLVKILMI